MPDWSYQSLFRPLLFKLPARVARAVTLRAMGGLSAIPGGSLVIRTLGHMEVSPLLRRRLNAIDFTYPVGLSGGTDPHGNAHGALAQFGLGFLEIGPVTVQPILHKEAISRDSAREALVYPDRLENDGLEAIAARMKRKQGHKLPVFFRICAMPGSSRDQVLTEFGQLLDRLGPYAAGFYLDFLDESRLQQEIGEAGSCTLEIMRSARSLVPGKPLFIYIPLALPDGKLTALVRLLGEHGLLSEGIVLGDGLRTAQGYEIGASAKAPTIDKLNLLKRELPDSFTLIAAGGIHEPQDALDCVDAGADLVQLHSGLVYSGPGLPKRINEALLHRIVTTEEAEAAPSFWSGWGWMCLLGLGMIISGIIAWIIAATTVVLPYDTAFLCITPATMESINNRLLPFMSHDRVTLAGTMISIGILYGQLGWHGLRSRLHWARTALLTSGIVGFSSFLLFLGYGFFDPLHAAAAVILLPMFLFSMRDRIEWPSRKPTNVRNDWVWRMAQRGQLMMVALGFALAIGGITISVIGVTHVFVPEDLEFLMTNSASLSSANGNLLPLIAHDRAGFGGALLSDAIALLAASLWGIGQGQRWLWWTFLAAGLPAFIAGFSVHLQIGYTDLLHLSPAIVALLLYVLGLIWLYPYMVKSATPYAGSRRIAIEGAD